MDVAKAAGVSKVTVSYVLNGHSTAARISESTAAKVLKAAKDLGYSPSAIARMMVTKRCSTLGVVFQQAQYFTVWSSFTNELMLGICQASVSSGYDLMLHTGSLSDARSEADSLSDGRVDGVLVLRNSHDGTLNELLRRALPMVLFFTRSENESIPFVDADNYEGGRIAAKHLLGLGHKRIAMVAGDPDSSSSNDRIRGYQDAMREASVEPDEKLFVRMISLEDDAEPFANLLKSTEPPTAVFCWSDDTALRCLEIARNMSVVVPDELSVVGFDSLAASEASVPPLTSVSQPVREIAKAATELLIKIVRGEPLEEQHLVFPVKLDIRESTTRLTK
jgi:DNA-binding LacI/PurR family transcriptional regulator